MRLQQLKQNRVSSSPSISISDGRNMEEEEEDISDGKKRNEDDLEAPPPTPYGTPHTSSHLYRANIDNICDKLDQLQEIK